MIRKHFVKDKEDWEVNKKEICDLNIDASINDTPKAFPCIAVVAYAGAGWDEVDFVYLADFGNIV